MYGYTGASMEGMRGTTCVILGLVPRTHRPAYSVRFDVRDAMRSYWTYILASKPRNA